MLEDESSTMTHALNTLTWISAVMAAFKADSNPPSAIRLLTNRSIMKRRPGLTLISFPDTRKQETEEEKQQETRE